mgnify:CR=1 FL=1
MDKILEKYKSNAIKSYELLRKKNMSTKEVILDILFDQLLSIKDSLSVEGAYYLFIYLRR